MTVGDRVRHSARPDLGVGTIRATVKPDVLEVVWEKRTDTGLRVWGYYRIASLLPADLHQEVPPPT